MGLLLVAVTPFTGLPTAWELREIPATDRGTPLLERPKMAASPTVLPRTVILKTVLSKILLGKMLLSKTDPPSTAKPRSTAY